MKNVIQMIMIVLTCIVGSMTAVSVHASDNKSCYEDSVKRFLEYQSELKTPNGNTAKYFNLKFLASEMEKSGVRREELRKKLIDYLSYLNELQSQVVVVSANVMCSQRNSRIVFSIREITSMLKDDFLIVRFLDGKIINISFHGASDKIEDGVIKDLDFFLISEMD